MGTYESRPAFPSFSLRTATLVAGALATAVITAAPALAEAPPGDPQAPVAAVTEPAPVLGTSFFGIPLPAPAPVAEPAPVAHTPQAPIPDTVIRVGNVEVPRPDFITPEQATQFNDAGLGAENGLAGALTAAGVEPSRSDQIAAEVLGTSAQGAVVGAALSTPIAATGALIGTAAGLVAGLPFAPAGLVVVPVIGAALGAAMIVVPFAAAGAAVGAAVGAVEGALAPPLPEATP